MTLSLIKRLEAHSARCWPAQYVDALAGWEIRRTPDVPSGRINSVTPVNPVAGKFNEVLLRARALFAEMDEWPLIRITPLAGEDTIDHLRAWGLQGEGHTLVKTVTLSEHHLADHDHTSLMSEVHPALVTAWMTVYAEAHDSDDAARFALTKRLNAIGIEQAYIVIYDGAEPVAVGRAAKDGDIIGLFQIATRPHRRRRGYGRAAVAGLLAWGRQKGATQAYLQVEAKNSDANRLYDAFGFASLYEYSYWWLPDDIEILDPTTK